MPPFSILLAKNVINFGEVRRSGAEQEGYSAACPSVRRCTGRAVGLFCVNPPFELNEILGDEKLPKYDYAQKAVWEAASVIMRVS